MVLKEGAFDMGTWIKEAACGTTYCRGGAAILAAGEAGMKLKEQTSDEFAAMAIYNASSTIMVSPVRFYESNELAMKDIQRCAALEKEQAKK